MRDVPGAPRVSVVLRVFNGERYLRETMTSVLDQDFSDFEFLIVDDGSTDATPAIVREYGDPRIRYMRHPNMGLPKTTSRGIDEAKADLIALIDADDRMLPARLSRQVAEFERDRRLVILGSDLAIIDEAGRVTGTRRYPRTDREIRNVLLDFNPFANPSVMFRRRAALECGGVTDRFATVEDYDCWLRLLRYGTGANVPEVLTEYRLHADSVKSTRTKLQLRETIALRSYAASNYGYGRSLRTRAVDVGQRALCALPVEAIAVLFRLTFIRSR